MLRREKAAQQHAKPGRAEQPPSRMNCVFRQWVIGAVADATWRHLRNIGSTRAGVRDGRMRRRKRTIRKRLSGCQKPGSISLSWTRTLSDRPGVNPRADFIRDPGGCNVAERNKVTSVAATAASGPLNILLTSLRHHHRYMSVSTSRTSIILIWPGSKCHSRSATAVTAESVANT
jgi:hypothetical protein